MKLNPFRRKGEAVPEPKTKLGITPHDVWSAPVDFNRVTRRWAHLWGNIWRWDTGPKPPSVPRYARRHYAPDLLTHPKTRRQRRHKARIMRIMKGQA